MYFIGDTHGIRPIFKIVDKYNLQNENLIHVGDLGLGFTEIRRDVENLIVLDEMLIENNLHLYAIRGNHDNPIFWDTKTLNLPPLHNTHLIPDYTVMKLESKNILMIGGAKSIDRSVRMDELPYPTWWKDEVFIYNHEKIDKITKTYDNIDIVVTHTAPQFAYPQSDNVGIVNDWHEVELQHGRNLKYELKEERADLTQLYDDLVTERGYNISHWLYGHFHSSRKEKIGKTEFKLLSVNELYKI